MIKGTVVILAVMVGFAMSSVAYGEDASMSVKRISAETLNKFRQHTTSLREELEAKDLELRHEYAYDAPNLARIAEIEDDMKEIKAKIRSVAASLNIEPCCCL